MTADGELHPFDQLVVDAGVRWSVLRWIVPAARRQLAGQVAQRQDAVPTGTRRADSATLWLDAVAERIAVSPEFRQDAKRSRWLFICGCFAERAEAEGRPLTWITQAEIAGIAGVDPRTVGRVVAWLRHEGLVAELVGGQRLPMMSRPVDETEAEAEQRRATEHAAAAAEDAQMAHARAQLASRRDRARAELDAVRAGHDGTQAALIASETVEQLPEVPADWVPSSERSLVNLAPVYELRVPLTEAEAAERAASRKAVRSADQVFVYPPSGSTKDGESRGVRVVEKVGRAPRGIDQRGFETSEDPAGLAVGGSKPSRRGVGSGKQSSAAQIAAERLVRSLLPPQLAEGLSIRRTAALLRGTGLLAAGWTEQDLAAWICGDTDQPHLPRYIHSPQGFVTARLRQASPQLPPSKVAAISDVYDRLSAERRATRRAAEHPGYTPYDRRAARQSERAERRQSAGRAKRAAIEACPLCDEYGWLAIPDPAVGEVRCNHDADSGGW